MSLLYRGMTLIELMASIAITSILAAAGIPAYTDLVARQNANSFSNTLYRRLVLARNSAISLNTTVTICGSRDGLSCVKDGISSLLVFRDVNRNHKIDISDSVLQNTSLKTKGTQVRLGAALGRNYIEFNASGRARQTGSFYYCPKNRDPRMAKRVTVSLTGRAYIARDGNGDGIVELTNGKPITC